MHQPNPIHPTKRHPLTGDPIQAIWTRPDGRVVWPIMGGDDTVTPAGDAPAGDPPAGDPPADDKLGEAGKQALDSERTARKNAERAAKPWTKIADEFGVTPDEARDILAAAKKATTPPKGDKPEEVDADKIRRDAERAANDKANARIIRSEVRAHAAELFADPADAALYVDLTKFEVDDDGEVDAAEIKKALAAVITAKPHLAKKGKGPKPDPSQGPQGGSKTDPGPGVARLRQAYAQSAN